MKFTLNGTKEGIISKKSLAARDVIQVLGQGVRLLPNVTIIKGLLTLRDGSNGNDGSAVTRAASAHWIYEQATRATVERGVRNFTTEAYEKKTEIRT